MSKWENDWGEEFETEEEARENIYSHIDAGSYQYYLSILIAYDELLGWASQHDGFWDDFAEQIREAEDNFFQDNYSKVEEEEEED